MLRKGHLASGLSGVGSLGVPLHCPPPFPFTYQPPFSPLIPFPFLVILILSRCQRRSSPNSVQRGCFRCVFFQPCFFLARSPSSPCPPSHRRQPNSKPGLPNRKSSTRNSSTSSRKPFAPSNGTPRPSSAAFTARISSQLPPAAAPWTSRLSSLPSRIPTQSTPPSSPPTSASASFRTPPSSPAPGAPAAPAMAIPSLANPASYTFTFTASAAGSASPPRKLSSLANPRHILLSVRSALVLISASPYFPTSSVVHSRQLLLVCIRRHV